MWFPRKRPTSGLYVGFIVLACVLGVLSQCAADAQQSPQRPCEITVNIRSADGSPPDVPTNVSLYMFGNGSPINVAQPRAGVVVLGNLVPSRYSVEVTATGYEPFTQAVDLHVAGQTEQVYVSLTPRSLGRGASTSSVPVLAPNARKELARILEDLRVNRSADARKRLEKVSRTAPSYPDVNYLWGAYYSQVQDHVHAREYWEKALQQDPRHVFALIALTQVATDDGEVPKAVGYLERVVTVQPSSWPYQLRLAAAYLANHDPEKAEKCATRAIDLGQEHAADGHLILAQVYAQQKDQAQVIKQLEAYLRMNPSSPRAAQIREWITKLRASPTPALAPVGGSEGAASSRPDNATFNLPIATGSEMLPWLASDRVAERSKWLPADVDHSRPPVEAGVACPFNEIRQKTGERVREFVSAVNRISATEYLENEVIDESGTARHRESRRYNYVVAVSRVPTSQLVKVDEYRDGSSDIEHFPEHVATLGVPAMVLIFDPAFRDDYEMNCEGLSSGRNKSEGATWQVYFRQKQSKPARLRGYTIGRRSYALSLRGRAWIAADSFQVVALETDIVAPLPAIQLNAEHDIIEYAPVKFSKNNQELWLPASAELYLDFHGHRIHRRHDFRHYMLFSVDDTQKISQPRAKLESLPAETAQ
jgi:Tfp pilus assembly protein PilF